MSINYAEALSRHLETVIADESAYSRIWLREVLRRSKSKIP